mmetsp:Transcript_21488/g.43273  ORF Transcript_21488/g.43273 Transcript_21488/m.43273 type:complete len:274 (-) Transcript_21488:82-903(-)
MKMCTFLMPNMSRCAAAVLTFSPLFLLVCPSSALVHSSRENLSSKLGLHRPLPLRSPQAQAIPELSRKPLQDTVLLEDKGLEHLRGGAGKKMGGKNMGLVLLFLSLLYMPRAMSFCKARFDPRSKKIQGLGCGVSLPATNMAVLAGIGLVLVNSRQFDRHGRSKFKMRLTGSVVIILGMFLVFAHAEAASLSMYSKVNAYIGLILEWWGFVSLFYNFTPRLVAQMPRELSKTFHKLLVKAGLAKPDQPFKVDQEARQRELDRLNRWAQANQGQ